VSGEALSDPPIASYHRRRLESLTGLVREIEDSDRGCGLIEPYGNMRYLTPPRMLPGSLTLGEGMEANGCMSEATSCLTPKVVRYGE
jgi:hypothetical protein